MTMYTRLSMAGRVLLFTLALTGSMMATTTAHATIVGNQQVISLPIDSVNTQTQALLWLPDTYSTDSTSTTYPLIINLHGAGDAGTDITLMLNPGLLSRRIADGFNPQAINPIDGKRYKFIVVSPQAPSWSYSYSNIKAMLPYLLANYRVNTDRIYITGLSAGGQGSWSAVTDDATNSINISAIAPMSAASLNSTQVPNVVNAATNNIGVWSLMGSLDSFLSSTVDYTNRVNAASPPTPAKLTVINGVGHSSWIEGFDDLWRANGMNIFEWMLTNKRGTPNPTNALPTVSLTAPTNNAVFTTAQPITLTATASDSDGTVANVSFYNGNTLLSTVTTAPYAYTWANPGTGNYAVFARATDNTGAVSNSDTVRITVLTQSNQSLPYGGTARAIPGTIQAEDYDIGGQGIAYSDTTPENTGNWYRPYEGVDVEIATTEPGGNQYYVGWPSAGEWMNYTVNVAQTGTYTMQVRTASPYTGKSFTVAMDGTTVASVAVPQTTDLTTYVTTTIPNVQLTAGKHVMKITDVTDGFNINWLSFAVAANQLPVVNAGVDQTITLPTNSASLSGSATDPDGTIASYAWTQVSGPNTASIATPSAAATTVSGLIAGAYTFRLTATDNSGGTAYDDMIVTVQTAASTPYGGTARTIPGTIQAEDYDSGGEGIAYHDTDTANQGKKYRPTEGVDIENKTGGGYDVGWTAVGEWMKYTVNITTAGNYTLQATTAVPYSTSASITFSVDGANLITAVMPQTASFQTWKTFTAGTVTLPQGVHVIKLYENATNFNIDSFTLTYNGNASPVISTAGMTSVSLIGTASDADGTVTSYAWTQVSGPTATIVTPNALTTTVNGLTSGTYTFRFTATDNLGATASKDVQVVI